MPVRTKEDPSSETACQRPCIKRRFRFREYTAAPDAPEAEPLFSITASIGFVLHAVRLTRPAA